MISTNDQKRLTKWTHVVEASLIVVLFAIAVARIAVVGQVRSRLDIWPIPVSIKSLVFLAYIELSQRWSKMERWKSVKAFMILTIVDVVFWIALVALSCMALANAYGGPTAIVLSGVQAMLAISLVYASIVLTYLYAIRFKASKNQGHDPYEARWQDEQGKQYYASIE